MLRRMEGHLYTMGTLVPRFILKLIRSPKQHTRMTNVKREYRQENHGAIERIEKPLDRNHSAVPAASQFYRPIDRPGEQENGHG